MEWSREKLILKGIEILESGGRLTSTYFSQNQLSSLTNAIVYRTSDGKRKYFESFKDFREAITLELEKRGNSRLVEMVRDTSREDWTRKKIILSAVKLLRSGGHLSSHYLLQHNLSSLHNAIYYAGPDKRKKYFKSFGELRKAVSDKLKEFGDMELAEKILSPSYKQKIISDEENNKRKQQTLQSLEEKITSHENLSLRFQKKNDSLFYYYCIKYFGSYKGIFDAKKLNYEDFIKIKRDRTQYEELFLSILRKNPSITKKELMNNYNSVWTGLSNHYNGNRTRALQAVASKVKEEWLSGKVLSLIEKEYRHTSKEKRLAREKKSRSMVRIIEPNESYSTKDMPEFVNSINLVGKELYELLQTSTDWYSTSKAARMLGCGTSNLLKNFVHKHPDKIIKYKSRSFESYFFHKSIFENYAPKISRDLGDIETFARENNVSYSKVRSLLKMMGSKPKYVGRKRELADMEKRILLSLLEYEK